MRKKGRANRWLDGPRFDLAGGQTGRADRQQAFDIRGTEIRRRSIGAWTSRLIGTEDLEQRGQRARIAAIVDDGQLGGDQRREEQDAEEP